MVFAASLLGGGAFMACSWVWLASALDSSLATRSLATSLDFNVFIDLLSHHGASLKVFLFMALGLLVVGSLLWVGINSIVLAALTGRRLSFADARRVGLEKYFPFLKLWVAATTAYTLSIGGTYLGGHLLLRWTAAGASEMTHYGIVATCVVLGMAAILAIATIHDHARIRCLETGEAATASGLWACAYVVRERRALPLASLLACTTVVGWVVYQLAGSVVATDSATGLSISLIIAQVFMAFRALVRVWAFAAATDLQGSWEST